LIRKDILDTSAGIDSALCEGGLS